jgi:hypothetical protein
MKKTSPPDKPKPKKESKKCPFRAAMHGLKL